MHRAFWSRAAPSLAGALALLSAACATTHFTESGFVTSPPGAKGKARSAVSLEIQGLRLRLETLDRAPQSETIPPFAVRIVFDPRELGYSFDPGQVVLRTSDGREWRATGGGYQPVYPEAGCDLVFGDVAVPPGASFELVLAGLARGQTPLEPVTLRLARRSGTSIDRLYWLDVLEVLTMLPTY